MALAIVGFYHYHADESALTTLSRIAECEPKRVSPKWRPVIEAARQIPRVEFVAGRRKTEDGESPANEQAEFNRGSPAQI